MASVAKLTFVVADRDLRGQGRGMTGFVAV